jgi:hypothetical protein
MQKPSSWSGRSLAQRLLFLNQNIGVCGLTDRFVTGFERQVVSLKRKVVAVANVALAMACMLIELAVAQLDEPAYVHVLPHFQDEAAARVEAILLGATDERPAVKDSALDPSEDRPIRCWDAGSVSNSMGSENAIMGLTVLRFFRPDADWAIN